MNRRRPCLCHSGKPYGRCCRPFHRGKALPDPEQLMRSRFCAYARGLVGYIQQTGEDRRDTEQWAREIRAFCEAVDFVGLEILEVEPGEQVAYVTFKADLLAGDRDVGFTERSRFERTDRWRYVSGDRLAG